MKKEAFQWFFIILFVFLLFFISYLYRKNKNDDIQENSKFTIATILKFTTSLKSGDAWYYRFSYQGKSYDGYRSTHVDYEVKIGDYFLVQFSSKDPVHNQILYEYKLNSDKLNYIDSVWDKLPQSILHRPLKN